MNRNRRPKNKFYYGGYNHPYYNYNSYDLYNSQYSNVAQSIYNAGYMAGVNQISTVNQYGPMPSPYWW